ncbi:MAG: hypothetical protein LQ344_005517 [Seirophora lacunosa]|nr:MAG: hypothetical protein LQ344_005517 [Seirophora lacunosa]
MELRRAKLKAMAAAPPSAADTHLDSTLLELSWALFAITFIISSLRFLSDSYILHSFKLPSYLALLAFLIALASQVLIACAVHYGLGEHIGSLNQRDTSLVLTYIWQAQPLQLLANTTGKVAIAALLVTLHGPRFCKVKTIFIWTLVGVQAAFVAISIAMIYTQCTPVAKLWRHSLTGTCKGRERNQNFAYAQGAGSLPGLRPLFNKRMRVSSNRNSSYDSAPRQNRAENQNMILKLSSLPTGRNKAYASTSNHHLAGSTENILTTMGHGGIVKTTEVKVKSGRNSVQGQTCRQVGDEYQNTQWSDIEAARVD